MRAPGSWSNLRGLGARTLAQVVLPAVAILAGIVVYTTLSLSARLRSEAEDALQVLARNVAGEVERSNAEAVLAAQMMAQAQVGGGLFGQRAASIELARQVLQQHPEFTGAYFGYEPDADGADARFRDDIDPVLTGAHDETGRFLPYWYRDIEDDTVLRLAPLVDMETSLYYDGCRRLFRERGPGHSMVTEPYVYEGKMIVEQTHPIVIDGRFRGIAGVDRALTDLNDFARDIEARTGVDIFLISRAGRFITTTTPERQLLITEGVDSTLYADLFGPFLADRDSRPLELAEDPTDGERYYFATAPVPTGTWTVVVRKLESDVVAPIRRSLWTTLAIAAVGLVAVIALATWTTRSVTGRLRQAVDAADAVASGSLSADIGTGLSGDDRGDEVAALMASLRRMVVSLEQKMSTIDAIAHGDTSRPVEVAGAEDALGRSLQDMSLSLRNIVAHAGRIAEGDYTQMLEPRSDADELSHAINRMTQALADAQSRLEQRVRQRTEELGDRARELETRTTELQALTEQSQARLAQESSLATLTARLQGDLGVETVAQRALDGIVEFVDAPVGALFVLEPDGRLHRRAAHALPPEAATADVFAVGTGTVGQVAASRKVSVYRPAEETGSVAFGLMRVSPRRVLTVPLVATETLAGVLELYLMEDLEAPQSEWLSKACDIAAVSLRLASQSLEREAAEEQTRLILQSTGEAIFGLDTSGRATFVNPVACELLGYEAEELIGEKTHAAIHHTHADGSPYPVETCPMRQAFTEGVVTRVDDEVLWRKDGTAVHVEYTSTPILKEGEILGAVISIRDITERREADARLRAREEQFRTLLDSAPDAMVISSEDGVITMVNRQTESLFGWTRDELIGRTVEVLMPERFRAGHPDKRNAFVADHSSRAMGAELALRAVTKDGREFPIEVSLSPIQTEKGLMVASALRDISERAEADAAVHRNQQRMAALFDALPVGVVMIDPKGQIVQANGLTESILGVSADAHRMRDLQSQEWRIVREDGTPMPVEEYPASRALGGEGEVRNIIMGVHRPQGDLVWISTSAAPIAADAGGGVAVAFEDITERRAQAQREQLLARFREAVWKLDGRSGVPDLLEPLRGVIDDAGISYNAFGVNLVVSEPEERIHVYTTGAHGFHDRPLEPVHALKVLDFWRAGDIVNRADLWADDNLQELASWKTTGEEAARQGPRSIVDIPFSHGTLAANSSEADAFTPHLGLLADIAGVLSEGFRRLDDLRAARGEA